MTDLELMKIALRMVDKGYTQFDQVRDCDDLYNATREEKDKCCEFVDEILDDGRDAFNERLSELENH